LVTPGGRETEVSVFLLFVLIGWTIYPVGFLMALAGEGGESWREICYNIADVINKVFFGLVCYQGVKGLQDSKSHAAHA
jgi:bacteriorhodopsin